MGDLFEGVTTIISALVTLIFVLALAYIVLRWVGRRMPAQTGSKQIKVLDRVPVSQDKCLMLVSVAGKVMLIGMSNGAVEKLCDFEGEAAEALCTPEQAATMSFSDALKENMKKNWGGGAERVKEGRDE